MELDPYVARPPIEADVPETLRCRLHCAERSLATAPPVLAESVELQVPAEEQESAVTAPARPNLDELIADRIRLEIGEARSMGFKGEYMEGVIRRTVTRRLRGYAGTFDIMIENGLYGKP